MFCVTLNIHTGRSSLQQGSWSSILLDLPEAVRSQKLHRDIFLFVGILKSSNGKTRVYIAVEHRVIGAQAGCRRKNKSSPNRRKKGRKVMMFCWSKFTDFRALKEKVTHSSVMR